MYVISFFIMKERNDSESFSLNSVTSDRKDHKSEKSYNIVFIIMFIYLLEEL